jgi:misacylated tRNA(Ala) deacylase
MPTLHNLQLFLIPHTDALSRSTATSARLYFLAGPRLITYLSSTNALLADASSILSCGPSLVPERTNQVIEERKKAEKRVSDLEAELAELLAGQLVKQAQRSNEVRFVLHERRNDDTLGFLSAISHGFINQWSESSKAYLIVLSSSPASQTTSSTSVVVIFGSDEKIVKEVRDGLKAKIGVKGGGKGNKWSGKFTGVWKDHKEGAGIEEVLQKYKQ